jgi:nucleolar protein 4
MTTKQDEKSKDKRNLYLAMEGGAFAWYCHARSRLVVIAPESEAAQGVSKEDMEKRIRGEKDKRTKLNNPNFFVCHCRLVSCSRSPLQVSNTRLSVRNIPLTVDEKRLKKIFLDAARDTGPNAPKLKQVKLMREKDRLDLSGRPKSKGIGFVEFMVRPNVACPSPRKTFLMKANYVLAGTPSCLGCLASRQ